VPVRLATVDRSWSWNPHERTIFKFPVWRLWFGEQPADLINFLAVGVFRMRVRRHVMPDRIVVHEPHLTARANRHGLGAHAAAVMVASGFGDGPVSSLLPQPVAETNRPAINRALRMVINLGNYPVRKPTQLANHRPNQICDA
jgi:hypothetical protein